MLLNGYRLHLDTYFYVNEVSSNIQVGTPLSSIINDFQSFNAIKSRATNNDTYQFIRHSYEKKENVLSLQVTNDQFLSLKSVV